MRPGHYSAQRMPDIIVIAKPDAVERGLCNAIREAYTLRGFKIMGELMVQSASHHEATAAMLQRHYAEHKDKPFYSDLIREMGRRSFQVFHLRKEAVRPCSPEDVIAEGREVCMNLRACFALANPRNTVHASDSIEAGHREVSIWFPGHVQHRKGPS